MINSTQLRLERNRLLFNTLVNSFKYLNKDIKLALKPKLYLDLSQLSLTDTQQSLFRPFTEPIYRTSINQTGEHSQSCGKSITNGTHTHNDVNISLNSGQIHRENVHLVRLESFLGAVTLTTVYDVFHVLFVVNVGHITTIQNVIDVLEHLLVDDLCVNEKET